MNDAEKLNLLADWFDSEQAKTRWGDSSEVQEDLRDMARRLIAIGGNIPKQISLASDVCNHSWVIITADLAICKFCGERR